MTETLVQLAENIVNGKPDFDIVICPERDKTCVLELNCGEKCPKAKAAHKVFQERFPRVTTEDHGVHGMLTAGSDASFETIVGQVYYSRH